MTWKTMIPALALTGACAMFKGSNNDQPKSQALSAQDQAAQQFQAAADAQKKAADEQNKAEAADQKVADLQKQLAQAQADARGQHAKAQQAQSEARDLADQAHAQGTQAQERAQKAQVTEQKRDEQMVQQRRSTWTKQQTAHGQVLSASGDQVQIRSGDQQLNLGLSDSTNIKIDGSQAKATQIQPGDDVRASYQMVDGQAHALELDVTSNNQNSSSQSSSSSGK